MNPIPFFKMSGCGNDFIVIDHRRPLLSGWNLSEFSARVCRRRISVGADGCILIEASKNADFKWAFFNSDGSTPGMCGNGARCAARFAFVNGICGSPMTFETGAGLIRAEIEEDRVKIRMTDPRDYVPEGILHLEDDPSVTVSAIHTGVPHALIRVDDIDGVDVVGLGRKIRFHGRFAPEGTNADFVEFSEDGLVSVRTYERGVEDETLACGTGSVAAAIFAALETGMASPVRVRTRSGGILTVYFQRDGDSFREVCLEGDARIVYRGEILEEGWAEPMG
jgi:diaminopimelate epimerase